MSEPLLFLIPARGGSKGLFRKNVRDVGGIPLVGRAARLGRAAARARSTSARVVCSTDDADIADAARSWGAEVPFVRPAPLSSDGARTIDVVYHALDELQEEFAAVVLLQPTSPLTEVDDVVGAIDLHRHRGMPVVSVCPAEHPAEWLFAMDDRGRLARLLNDTELPTQRQAARVSYRVNGAVYVCSPDALRQHDSFFGPHTCGFLMPASRSVDIDTEVDLTIARALAGARAVRSVALGRRTIGAGERCYVIASSHLRHDDPAWPSHFVNAAATAGADAIAIQNENTTPIDDATWAQLTQHCNAHGLAVISTAWDEKVCDVLAKQDVTALKLPSSALERHSLLRHAAQAGKPLLLAIANLELAKVAEAVDTIEDAGCRTFVLLNSADKSPARDRGALRRLTTLRDAFGVPVGLADCDDNDSIAAAAVVLGASVLEKQVFLTPSPSFSRMIQHLRDVESQLASPTPPQ